MASPSAKSPPAGGNREHPTRTRLIETAQALLDTHPWASVTADQVLSTSRVTKGSLYHHFEDFDDLIATAMVREFARAVQETIDAARAEFARCDSAAAVQPLMRRLTRLSQDPAMRVRRMKRIRLIVFSQGHPRHQELLAAEQARLTDALTDLFRHAQAQGWINREFDPRAGAVLIQAYSIGRIVDDITDSPLDDDRWLQLIDLLTSRVFSPPG